MYVALSLFEDYLKGYSHWGYCDLDMVIGNLPYFLELDELAGQAASLYSSYTSHWSSRGAGSVACLRLSPSLLSRMPHMQYKVSSIKCKGLSALACPRLPSALGTWH